MVLKSNYQENLTIPTVLFDKLKYSFKDIANDVTENFLLGMVICL